MRVTVTKHTMQEQTIQTTNSSSVKRYCRNKQKLSVLVRATCVVGTATAVWYQIYCCNSSMVSTLVRVVLVLQEYMVSILNRSRALCAGHALLGSSYGSAVRELKTLCYRPSRVCSSCSVALKACSCVLVVLLVVSAVCGQRADALPPLVARSHALVYWCCWYSSMASILALALSP